MGLTAPISTEDPYSIAIKAQNLQFMDQHDHTPGRGVRLTGNSLVPGTLTGSNLSSRFGTVAPTQAGFQSGNVAPVYAVASQPIAFNAPYIITFASTFPAPPVVTVSAAATYNGVNVAPVLAVTADVTTTGFHLYATIGPPTTTGQGDGSYPPYDVGGTVGSSSGGASVSSFVGSQSLSTATMVGTWPAKGFFAINTSTSQLAYFSYNGVTGTTSLNNVTYLTGGSGTIATGAAIYSAFQTNVFWIAAVQTQ